jgi:hypothetical protein
MGMPAHQHVRDQQCAVDQRQEQSWIFSDRSMPTGWSSTRAGEEDLHEIARGCTARGFARAAQYVHQVIAYRSESGFPPGMKYFASTRSAIRGTESCDRAPHAAVRIAVTAAAARITSSAIPDDPELPQRESDHARAPDETAHATPE